tara:strand:- start:2701 stop:3012 length:312 start_codon:yes stop_codon:yes gene_type:complete
METILTVLSTVGVGALAYAFAGVIRLSRRVSDLELIRMEMVDLQEQLESEIRHESRERDDLSRIFSDRESQNNSNIDRRFDKVWAEHHALNDLVKKLDISKSY